MEINKSEIPSIDILLSQDEYAKIKNITRQAVYYLIEKNIIDYIIIGKIKYVIYNHKAKKYIRRKN